MVYLIYIRLSGGYFIIKVVDGYFNFKYFVFYFRKYIDNFLRVVYVLLLDDM